MVDKVFIDSSNKRTEYGKKYQANAEELALEKLQELLEKDGYNTSVYTFDDEDLDHSNGGSDGKYTIELDNKKGESCGIRVYGYFKETKTYDLGFYNYDIESVIFDGIETYEELLRYMEEENE